MDSCLNEITHPSPFQEFFFSFCTVCLPKRPKDLPARVRVCFENADDRGETKQRRRRVLFILGHSLARTHTHARGCSCHFIFFLIVTLMAPSCQSKKAWAITAGTRTTTMAQTAEMSKASGSVFYCVPSHIVCTPEQGGHFYLVFRCQNPPQTNQIKYARPQERCPADLFICFPLGK